MPDTQVLVIGSGVAGLTYALKVAGFAEVTLITKKEHTESSTNYAQGGIAAVMAADDTPELHIEDTLTAGAGLCHRDAVEQVVREGPARVRELIDWGARFTTEPDEQGHLQLALGREGGHSRRRIVHAKDLTGREVERTLVSAVQSHPRILVLEHHIAIELLVADQNDEVIDRSEARDRGCARVRRGAGPRRFDLAAPGQHLRCLRLHFHHPLARSRSRFVPAAAAYFARPKIRRLAEGSGSQEGTKPHIVESKRMAPSRW